MLGRCNEVFMNAYAQETFHITKENIPYVTMIFNISWAFFSYPVGIISDKFGRFKVLAVGIFTMVLSDLCFYSANSLFIFFLGVIFWGAQTGMTTNSFITLIIDSVKPNLRGTAFGCYYLINAICLFCADAFGGKITDCFGSHAYMYLISSFFGAFAFVMLLLMNRSIMNEAHKNESV